MEVTMKGAVVSKYGSAGKFADFVGWSGRKARDILSGRQNPTPRDMVIISDAIGINTPTEFCQIFFPEQYTKWIAEKNTATNLAPTQGN